MMKEVFVALAGLAVTASAKSCQNMTIPVQIEARQGVFNVPPLTTNQDVTTFVQNTTNIRSGKNFTQEALTGYQTVTGSYQISAKFCTPDNGLGANPAVQVLTHGIGFDKSYWDLPFNNFNYSYENIATAAGYCTLSIDRFGVGNSSHADPYQIVQAPAEVSALYQINTMLRNGNLPGVSHAFGTGKIVNVGHSFGSQQSLMLANMYPSATDALILTGFGLNTSFLNFGTFDAKMARLNQPLRFGSPNTAAIMSLISSNLDSALATAHQAASLAGLDDSAINNILSTTGLGDLIAGYNVTGQGAPGDYPNGYITWADAGANQLNFLYPPGHDPALLTYAEASKQPFSVGEALTLGGAPAISPFTGPVHILTGRQDAIYCGGDCLATGLPNVTSIPAAAGMYFPQAKNFNVNIPESVGHAITVHYAANAAYQQVQSYLKAQGIVSA